MLLFLDVVSSIPEFSLIEDNKVILRRKIIREENEKLSDNIFEVYTQINKEVNLQQNLEKISITIGPGSYTSLRVGASFVSGLKINNKILYYAFSVNDIFNLKSNQYKKNNIGIFISSANKQKFFCSLDSKKKPNCIKIEDKEFTLPDNIEIIFYNHEEINSKQKIVKQTKFSFFELFFNNHRNFNFSENEIIRPLYISNNSILN